MKIIAAVPTYNRPQLLIKNINCLLAQTRKLYQIIVVDNESKADTKIALCDNGFLNHPVVKYIRVDSNIGASGGFRVGIENALINGADWIWLMDDDAFPETNALENITKNGLIPMNCYWSNCDNDKNFIDIYKEVSDMMFVGPLISKTLISKIGLPDLNFYMYYDDTEYSNRIIKNGGKILKMRDSIIKHEDWRTRGETPFSLRSIFGKKISIFNGDGVRLYYMTRNEYYITERAIIDRVLFVVKKILVLAAYTIYRPTVAPFVLIAISDILQKRRGKRDFNNGIFGNIFNLINKIR